MCLAQGHNALTPVRLLSVFGKCVTVKPVLKGQSKIHVDKTKVLKTNGS